MTESKAERDGVPGIDGFQYEAIVGKRKEYYLPRFQRFARGGWLSWNWAAFFATLAWLRYRKLHAWSWLYFFVSTPFLLSVFLVLAAGTDPCERALAPQSFDFASLVVLGLALLGWIAPPLLANRLYFAHVRARIEEAAHAITPGHDAQPGKRLGTGGVAGAIVVQVIVLVGAALAVPSHGNYQYRARVSEGVTLGGALKTPLAEYFGKHGRVPARIEEIAGTTSGRYVSQVMLEPDGTIRAVFGASAEKLSGRSISIVPVRKDGRIVEWSCRSNDLPERCLPASCRR